MVRIFLRAIFDQLARGNQMSPHLLIIHLILQQVHFLQKQTEVKSIARQRGFTVLQSICRETDSGLPYGALLRLLPSLLALLVDPDAPVAADPYADPAYQVPDDLVW